MVQSSFLIPRAHEDSSSVSNVNIPIQAREEITTLVCVPDCFVLLPMDCFPTVAWYRGQKEASVRNGN